MICVLLQQLKVTKKQSLRGQTRGATMQKVAIQAPALQLKSPPGRVRCAAKSSHPKNVSNPTPCQCTRSTLKAFNGCNLSSTAAIGSTKKIRVIIFILLMAISICNLIYSFIFHNYLKVHLSMYVVGTIETRFVKNCLKMV